jgi:hypothetical protein
VFEVGEIGICHADELGRIRIRHAVAIRYTYAVAIRYVLGPFVFLYSVVIN